MFDLAAAPDYHLARLLFERCLGLIYFVAFLSALNQWKPLLGERGLLPVPEFLAASTFREAPSLFHWRYSDRLARIVCGAGMALSLLIAAGVAGRAPVALHVMTWLGVYFLYLSLVNVGQEFYGFGWETMLLEAGFFAAFLGPAHVTPSWIPILILRWMLVRTELGAGLIKLRGDPCWRDLTCLYYHYETQPLPNPLSRTFHHAPKWFHRAGVLFSHFCQLVVPLGLFLPWPASLVAGAFLVAHQLILVVSGNYAWLNWLTIVLALLVIRDPAPVPSAPAPAWFAVLQFAVLGLGLVLSYRPLLNLFSPRQYMNYCWNRWHLVGAYGAFGSVTKERYEIVLEGTADDDPAAAEWKEYGFRGKPDSLDRTPPVVAPYYLRLDWMIWFLPFTVSVVDRFVFVRGHRRWFLRLLLRLLLNDKDLLKLLRVNPFHSTAPKFVRATFYRYQFTTREEKRRSGAVWKREYYGQFCPPLSLDASSGALLENDEDQYKR